MSDAKDKNKSERDQSPATDLTEEIRRDREFSLTEAIGREAGASLKGASPVPPIRQLLLQIGELLSANLVDIEGSLTRTILAQLEGNPPLLARHFDDPVGALHKFLDTVLTTPGGLTELVRQTDARWGREYDERPYFEQNNQAPAPDDPYTVAGVRALLVELQDTLTQ